MDLRAVTVAVSSTRAVARSSMSIITMISGAIKAAASNAGQLRFKKEGGTPSVQTSYLAGAATALAGAAALTESTAAMVKVFVPTTFPPMRASTR
jgi:hypothetical protein